MKRICYHPNRYPALPDGEALDFARNLAQGHTDIRTSNDYVILAARVLVKRREIFAPIEVIYEKCEFNDKEIRCVIDSEGNLDGQPNGVIDYLFKELFGL